jgi:hypothetical protein
MLSRDSAEVKKIEIMEQKVIESFFVAAFLK